MNGLGNFCVSLTVFILLALPSTTNVSAAAEYTAAAVQYTDRGSVQYPASENLRTNWKSFASQAARAVTKGAQIIVFPEAVLWSIAFKSASPRDTIRNYGETLPSNVQIREQKLIPCDNKDGMFKSTPSLRNASCIARDHKIAIVYNTIDVQSCDPRLDTSCPTDGRYQFNTDVALDTDGTLLAVYHKVHIFGTSPALDEPGKPDVVSFKASFGVTFGLFICFDIEFMSPSLQLISQGIRNFAYSTSWVNQPPILTAQMVQQAWSRKYGANLIAANNGVSSAKSGGGIYSSGEVLAEFFNANATNVERTLIASLPKYPSTWENRPATATPTRANRGSGVAAAPNGTTCLVVDSLFGPMACSTFSGQGRHLVEVTSESGLHCSLDARVSQADSLMVLAAVVTTGHFPGTPDPLTYELCTIFRCLQPDARSLPPSQSELLCTPTFEAGKDVFSQIELAGNFTSSYRLLPALAVNDAQILSPSAFNVTRMGLTATGGTLGANRFYSAAVLGLPPSDDRWEELS